jgi:hypothetical protein
MMIRAERESHTLAMVTTILLPRSTAASLFSVAKPFCILRSSHSKPFAVQDRLWATGV